MFKPLVVLALSAAVPAFAQAPAAPPASPVPAATPAPPALPKPAPELQKLAFMLGDWVHEETYQATPFGPAGPGKGRSKVTWLLGDHHLTMTYAANTPAGRVEARGFLGYDSESKTYRMSWFDNMGLATHYTGQVAEDGSFTFTTEYAFQGQKIKEQFLVAKKDDGKLVLSARAQAPDGSWQPVMESVAAPFSPTPPPAPPKP